MLSAIQPKTPTSTASGWASVKHLLANARQLDAMGYPWTAWLHAETGMLVISAVEKPDPLPPANSMQAPNIT